MEDISFFVFTNEHYFDLLELTLPFLIENTSHLGVKINVISNKLPNGVRFSNVNYISGDVMFEDNGGHFGKTLIRTLPQISSKYILFLCDDYLFKSPIKKNRFQNLPKILESLDCDYLSLGTQKHIEVFVQNWKKVSLNLLEYEFPDGSIYEFDESARHLYSVQPCIWKKSSLLELLSYNPNITLHDLDNTNIFNKKGDKRILDPFYNFSFYERKKDFFDYEFKNFLLHYPPITYHVDEKELISDYFLIDYIEVVRHGKFLNANVNSKFILEKILETDRIKKIKNKLIKFFN